MVQLIRSITLLATMIGATAASCAAKRVPAAFGLVAGRRYRPSAAFRYRSFHTSPTLLQMTIADTPLGTAPGADLLDGLDIYTVPASEDGHPLTVYGINSNYDDSSKDGNSNRKPILMLHGRTWSSVPVYHLLGGPKQAAQKVQGRESRSLMEALYDVGLQPYAMDFRGFGGTPRDASRWVEPNRCVADVETVLKFVAERHPSGTDESSDDNSDGMPALMGWSQGALVAQLVGQKSPGLMSQLVLYGSIYDPLISYPRVPLYVENPDRRNETDVINEYDAAIEDFTVEGSIPPETARLFAEAALMSDPIKAQWNHLYQFNNCDPARVHVPTLVVAGDQDPYAPLRVQSELFSHLGRGADRSWSIIADADHAVHLLDGRERFVSQVKSFVRNGKKGLGHA